MHSKNKQEDTQIDLFCHINVDNQDTRGAHIPAMNDNRAYIVKLVKLQCSKCQGLVTGLHFSNFYCTADKT